MDFSIVEKSVENHQLPALPDSLRLPKVSEDRARYLGCSIM